MRQYSREYWAERLPLIKAFVNGSRIRYWTGTPQRNPDFCLPADHYMVEEAPPIIVPWDVLEDDIIAVSMNYYGQFLGHTREPSEREFGYSNIIEGFISLKAVKGISCSLPTSEWRKSLTYRPKE